MLRQKFVLDFGSKIFNQLLTALTGIVVARIAGPTVIGTVAFGLSYVSVFSFINGLFGSSHIKFISEGRDMAKCNATFGILQLSTLVIYVLVVIGFFLIQKFALGHQFETDDHIKVIFILLAYNSIAQLIRIPELTFIGKMEQARANIPNIVNSVIYNTLRITVVVLGYRAVELASAHLVAIVTVVPVSWYLFRKYPVGSWDRQLARDYLMVSVPIFLMTFTNTLIMHLGRLLLQFFSNSEELGYYSAAYSIGGMLLLVASTAGTLFFPLFSKAASEKKFGYMEEQITKYERFIFLFVMPGVIFLSIASHEIITFILSNTYIPSVDVFSLLIISSFMMIWAMPYGNILIGMGLFRLSAILSIMRLILFFILTVFLLHPEMFELGALGLSISILFNNVLMVVIFYSYSKKKSGVHPMKFNYRYPLFGIAVYLGGYLLYNVRIMQDVSYWIFLYGFLFFAIVYAWYYLTGWMNKTDLQQLVRMASVVKMKDYIKDELGKK